jgi:hypothetical protein
MGRKQTHAHMSCLHPGHADRLANSIQCRGLNGAPAKDAEEVMLNRSEHKAF